MAANTDPQKAQFGELPTFGADAAAAPGHSAFAGNSAADAGSAMFAGLTKELGGLRDTYAQEEGRKQGMIDGGNLKASPRDDGTISGRAYDQAASAIQGNVLEAQARTRVSSAFSDYMDLPQDQRQPDIFNKKLAAIQDEFQQKHVFPQQQGAFTVSFENLRNTYGRAVQADQDKRTQDTAKASLLVNTNSAMDTAHRVASLPGKEADAETGRQTSAYNTLLDEQVRQDVISSAQAAKMKEDFRQSVLRTRTMALFDAAPDGEKAAIAARFGKSYSSTLVNSDAGNEDAPRGVRNNNFTNIRDGKFAAAQPGYKGGDGDFAGFDTPEAGLRAASANLDSYARKGFDTVSKIITRWSPPSENDTGILVQTMARRLGVKPNDTLDMSDPALRAKLLQGLVEQETGKKPFTAEQIQGALQGGSAGGASANGPSTSGLSPDSYETVQAQMRARTRAIGAAANQQQRADLGEISEAQKQITGGYDVPEADWSRMQQKFGASADPDTRGAFETAASIRTMLAGFAGQRPEAIAAQIASASGGAKGFSDTQVTQIKAAQSYLERLRDDLAKDPLGRASRENAIAAPAPLDMSSPGALGASLAARRPAAELAAEHYGLPAPKWLRPDEITAFKSLAAEGGPRMIEAAGSVADTLGPRLDGFLKQVGGDAPKFAMAARLSAWGGDKGFLADLGERQRLQNDPTARGGMEMPARNGSDAVFSDVYGSALSAIPGMAAAARVAAKDVYEVRALRENLPRDVSGSGGDAMKRAAQQAAGATFEGDVQYGGVGLNKRGYWGGSNKVLAPLDMRADGVNSALKVLTDKDMQALPAPPVGADGKTPVSAAAIAAGNLVSQGHGVYWVALGDPAAKEPRYVQKPGGGKFTLDLNALAPAIRERAPSLYRGGGST